MISIFINWLILFGLVKAFERDRDDLDGLQVATVAIVPVLVVILVRGGLVLLFPEPLLMMILPPFALVGMTYFLLNKTLRIPALRSMAYTLVVVIVNEGLGFLLAA